MTGVWSDECLGFGRDDMDEHSFLELAGKSLHFAFFEFHRTVGEGEERIIGAALDVSAGMILRSALPDNDVSFPRDLVAVNLYAEALRNGIASETS